MSFNIDKYMKKKKRTCLDKIKLRYRLHQHKLKKLEKEQKNSLNTDEKQYNNDYIKVIKKNLLSLLKFVLWLLPIFIGIIFYDSLNAQFEYAWVIGLYLVWTSIQIQLRKNYKNRQELGEIDRIYKVFCQRYKSTGYIVTLFLAVFVPMNFVPLWLYFLIFFGITLYDKFLQLYLMMDTKQDLILEKLDLISGKNIK